jgi:hypothetical protein
MTLIPELERELERAIPTRRRRLRRRITLGIPVVLVVGTTAALAAGGVLPVGTPAKDPTAGHLRPHVGLGAISAGSVRVLPVQAADPDGGPPWGVRLATTTLGLGCLQAARLVNGRIGVLGRDNAFHNDGRFHPVPLDGVGHPGTCAQLDANHRLIASVVFGGVPASASLASDCYSPQVTSGVPKSKLCDPRSVRILYYGVLGPQAQSIVVGSRVIPTAGDDGAYLIVERMGKARIGGVSTTPFPMNSPITEIRFKDGSSCRIGPAGPIAPHHRCANPGYAAPLAPTVTSSDVRTPIHVTKRRNGKFWRVRIRFRARVPVTDASSGFALMLSTPSKRRPGRGIGTNTERDIKAGETVTFKLDFLAGHGVYRGEVTYQQNAGGPVAASSPNGVRVGRVSFRLP